LRLSLSKDEKEALNTMPNHYCTWLVLILVATASWAQPKARSVSLVGCYSDLAPPEPDSGDIVGAGTIRLRRQHNRYTGTFQQLRDDSGEGFPAVPLQNLVVNEVQKTISFVVRVHTYESNKQGNEILRASQVTGRFTRRGLKLQWNEPALQYARPNPLLKRTRNCA
jgi:hypothetical protein